MAPPRKFSNFFRSKSAAREAREAEAARLAQERMERAEAQRVEKRRRAIFESSIVEERGIEEDLLLRMGWKEIFEGRRWTRLVEKPRPANIEIVREFYFNMDPSTFGDTKQVVVRGCTVRVSPETINSYFGTSTTGACSLGMTTIMMLKTDEELLKDLCSPDHTRTADRTRLGDFCYEAHIWNLFISYSVQPVGRRSGFTSARLRAIYALKNDHPIDLGQLLFRQIEEHGKGAENRSLIFPSLITGLCEDAGVVVDGPGMALSVPTMIDFKSINYIRNLRDMPKLLSSKELAREERRAAQASSSHQSSSTASRPSTSSRRSTSGSRRSPSDPDLAELLRQNNALQQQIIATQQGKMTTMMRNRAEDQGTITHLQETIARLEARMQELQNKMMYGQAYQRRSVSRD